MHPNLQLDPAHEAERITLFIQQTLQEACYANLVVGLSGGIDSAVVAALAVRALGAEHVLGVLLPYRTSNPASEADALLVVEQLGIRHRCLDISAMADPLLQAAPAMSALRLGNILARSRMIALYDLSAEFRGLVAGTSNRTETLLGYFTLYGDSAAALKPIAHLYKCQVRALARWLGVPQTIIAKAPSADLWAGQTDEGDLGFSYDQADEGLYLLTECHWSADQIAAFGLDASIVRAIAKRMASTAFKRQEPPMLAPANPTAAAKECNG